MIDRVLHIGIEDRCAARRNRILPKRDVVRKAADAGEAHGGAHRNRDRAGLERAARTTVTGHLHLDDWAGRRRGRGRCRGRALGLVLVALLATGDCADGDDGREQSEAHCGTPPGHGLGGLWELRTSVVRGVACELFHNSAQYRAGITKRESNASTSFGPMKKRIVLCVLTALASSSLAGQGWTTQLGIQGGILRH